MKKQNLPLLLLVAGGAGLAYYLTKQSKQAKEAADSVNVEPAGEDQKERAADAIEEGTPGADGLITKEGARRLVQDRIIPGAKKLLQKAKQKFKSRKKRKSRVIVEPLETITKEEFEAPIPGSTKRKKRKAARLERVAQRKQRVKARRMKRRKKSVGVLPLSAAALLLRKKNRERMQKLRLAAIKKRRMLQNKVRQRLAMRSLLLGRKRRVKGFDNIPVMV